MQELSLIVTVPKLQKAWKVNPDGVRRLAKFVCAQSTSPMDVFVACIQQCYMGQETNLLK